MSNNNTYFYRGCECLHSGSKFTAVYWINKEESLNQVCHVDLTYIRRVNQKDIDNAIDSIYQSPNVINHLNK